MSISRVRCDIQGISPVYSHVEEAGVDFMSFFQKNLSVHVTKESEEEIEFDMVGIDAALANALRRILLSEVPSVAFHDVYISMNTSIIQDEVLAHRLGLIPLKIDFRKLDPREDGDELTDLNTVVFTLSVRGVKQPEARPEAPGIEGEEDAEGRYTKVYSRSLQWSPQGAQQERYGEEARPVHDDILIAKLGPDQEIKAELHAKRGIGKTHAKWSPVSTATYRLLPSISFTEPDYFTGEEADKLVKVCPLGVFDIEDMGGAAGGGAGGRGGRRAVVARPRDCTVCRECIRDPERAKRIKIERVMDHFIFSVESTGALPARELVMEGLKVLREKAATVASKMAEVLQPGDDGKPSSAAFLSGPAVARATSAVMRTTPDDLA